MRLESLIKGFNQGPFLSSNHPTNLLENPSNTKWGFHSNIYVSHHGMTSSIKGAISHVLLAEQKDLDFRIFGQGC